MSTDSARSDLLGGLSWVGFGLLILAESLRMERFSNMGAVLYSMPGFVPGILGSIIVLLGLALMWRGWRKSRLPAARQPSSDVAEIQEPLMNQRMAIALPLCLIYAAALLGRLPFWLATGAFLAIFTYCFTPSDIPRPRRLGVALGSGVITTLVIIGVFQYIFLVRLP